MGAKPCGTPCTTFRNQRGNGVLLRRRRSAIVAGVAAAAGAALSASPGESGRCVSQTDRTGDARMISHFSLPRLSLRFIPIWRRNFMVWKKMAGSSILGHLADPVIYMLGLGYGLGGMLPEIGGMPYITFLAAGTVCYSTMNSASFEVLYSGFTRMHEQRTWEAILNTPNTLDDIVFSEIVWAASKSLLSGLDRKSTRLNSSHSSISYSLFSFKKN